MTTNRLQGHTGIEKTGGAGPLFRGGSTNKYSRKPGLTQDINQARREHRPTLRFFGDPEVGETVRTIKGAVSKLPKYSKGLSYKKVRELKKHTWDLKKKGFVDPATGKKVYFSAADKKVADAVIDSYSISGNKSGPTATPAPVAKPMQPTQRAVNFVTDAITNSGPAQNAATIANPILATPKIKGKEAGISKETDISDELLKEFAKLGGRADLSESGSQDNLGQNSQTNEATEVKPGQPLQTGTNPQEKGEEVYLPDINFE